MEYSKEDLMEAKKQIWGVGENMGTEESKKIWEENAQFWDNAMGDESNEFHREVVRPKVTELLSPNPADYILDIACGNGNYSSYLAQRGASVVAFDYSKKMIELAKRRQSQYAKQIEFCVADATDRKSILELKRNRAFTKAVSNMAIMDITDIEILESFVPNKGHLTDAKTPFATVACACLDTSGYAFTPQNRSLRSQFCVDPGYAPPDKHTPTTETMH